MNYHKKYKIMDFIKSKGKLPTDQYGQYLELDDMIVWYGLQDKLNELEKSYIKREIRKMIEGELFMLELESDY